MLAWKLPVPTGVIMIGLESVLNIAVYEYKVNLKMERSHKYTKYSAENTKVENHEILTRIIFVWKAKCLKEYFPIDCHRRDLPPPTLHLTLLFQAKWVWGLKCESECKEYQQLEEKLWFLPHYEETGTPRDMAVQIIMFFFISKLSKYSQDFASSCSNNEYEYNPFLQTWLELYVARASVG